jgi:hypothetical protein
MNRLYTTDTKALNHVLMNDYLYEKPESARYNLSQILGSGILVVEGDKHKQQVNLFVHLILVIESSEIAFSVELW